MFFLIPFAVNWTEFIFLDIFAQRSKFWLCSVECNELKNWINAVKILFSSTSLLLWWRRGCYSSSSRRPRSSHLRPMPPPRKQQEEGAAAGGGGTRSSVSPQMIWQLRYWSTSTFIYCPPPPPSFLQWLSSKSSGMYARNQINSVCVDKGLENLSGTNNGARFLKGVDFPTCKQVPEQHLPRGQRGERHLLHPGGVLRPRRHQRGLLRIRVRRMLPEYEYLSPD